MYILNILKFYVKYLLNILCPYYKFIQTILLLDSNILLHSDHNDDDDIIMIRKIII
jgi:hypothetical protein